MTNIWEVEFEERWTDEEGFDEGANWKVSASSYEEALKKATKLALSKGRGFEHDEDGRMIYPVEVRLIRIERGDEIDA